MLNGWTRRDASASTQIQALAEGLCRLLAKAKHASSKKLKGCDLDPEALRQFEYFLRPIRAHRDG